VSHFAASLAFFAGVRPMCNNQPMRETGPPPELLIVASTDAATGDVRVGCRGRLVAGHTAEFYDAVHPLVAGAKRIALDFRDVTRLDSAGLGTVVRLYVSAKAAGCEVQLLNLGQGIRKMFSMTNLLSFFTVIDENDFHSL
jgi:anti-sigma B factor antagonist